MRLLPKHGTVRKSLAEARESILRKILRMVIDVNAQGQCDVGGSAHSPMLCVLKHCGAQGTEVGYVARSVELLLSNNARIKRPEPETPLLLASKQGYKEVVEILLDAGAKYDPDEYADDVRILQKCVKHNWLTITTNLLRICPFSEGSHLSKYSHAILSEAIEQNHEHGTMLRLLLQHDFDPNLQTVEMAIEKDMPQSVLWLLTAMAPGEDDYHEFRKNGANALLVAVERGREAISLMLLGKGARGGCRTLERAVENGMLGTLSALLRNGLRIKSYNNADDLGNSTTRCLTLAIRSGDTEVIDCLWKNFGQEQFVNDYRPLRGAIRNNEFQMTEFLLSGKYNFDIALLDGLSDSNMLKHLWKIAAKSIRVSDKKTVDAMLQFAVNTGKQRLWGYLALQYRHKNCIEADNGVEEGPIPSQGHNDISGFPIIYHTIGKYDSEMTEILLDRGVSPKKAFRTSSPASFSGLKIRSENWTPLHLAIILYIDLDKVVPESVSEDSIRRGQNRLIKTIKSLALSGAASWRTRVQMEVRKKSSQHALKKLSALDIVEHSYHMLHPKRRLLRRSLEYSRS
ncbi:ankyrin repeat-containing domain protein [Xylariaceae sp. FL0016]|nr:ankyrin repeat-containing domain protein [Xylariaceae sp. FL0016]